MRTYHRIILICLFIINLFVSLCPAFAADSNQTLSVEAQKDIQYVQKYPFSADKYIKKWKDRGELDIASKILAIEAEYDIENVRKYPYLAESYTQKWKDRGEPQIASKIQVIEVEYDLKLVQENPASGARLIKKWKARGAQEIANKIQSIEAAADIKHVQENPEIADLYVTKWKDRGEPQIASKIQVIEVEYDLKLVQENPASGARLIKKWKARGAQEIANKIQSIEAAADIKHVQENPEIADLYVTKWKDRGEPQIASKIQVIEVEYDLKLVQENPSSGARLIKKWNDLGKLDVVNKIQAIEAEVDVQDAHKHPYLAADYAKKWQESGDTETYEKLQKIELAYDTNRANLYSHLSSEIADKWYNRGFKDLAQQIDMSNLTSRNFEKIAQKWKYRGDTEFAKKVLDSEFEIDYKEAQKTEYITDIKNYVEKWQGKNRKDLAKKFEQLQKEIIDRIAGDRKQFDAKVNSQLDHSGISRYEIALFFKYGYKKLANEYANRVLEHWTAKDAKEIVDEYRFLEQICLLIDSDYYCKLYQEKIQASQEKLGDNVPYFPKNAPYFNVATPEEKTHFNSIEEILAYKMRPNIEFLKKYDIDSETWMQITESRMHDMLKEEMLFKIMYALALHSRTAPQEKIYNFTEAPSGETGLLGSFQPSINKIDIMRDLISNEAEFKGTLIHEMTHQLMEILYNNSSKPYRKNDIEREKIFTEIVANLSSYLDQYKFPMTSHSSLAYESTLYITTLYNKENYNTEFIVRLPQLIAFGLYKYPEVQDMVAPLKEYWDKYVAPDIENYIIEHAEYGDFKTDYFKEMFEYPMHSAKAEKLKQQFEQKQQLEDN